MLKRIISSIKPKYIKSFCSQQTVPSLQNLCIQVVPMPQDTNPNGDIFGGWLVSQMDLAGLIGCRKVCYGRYATVAMNSIYFKQPVKLGDALSIYCIPEKIGNTSITLDIKSYLTSFHNEPVVEVSSALFTFVRINERGKPIPICFQKK